MNQTLGIVGAGGFGTALAHRVASAGHDVVLWSTTPEVVVTINDQRHNHDRLADVTIDERVRATSDPGDLARSARIIVIAVASEDVRSRLDRLGDHVDGRHILVHAIGASAGPDAADARVSTLVTDKTAVRRIGSLAGPALPGDVAHGHFAAMVCASPFDEVTREVRRFLSIPPALRLYTSRDLIGVELAAVLSGAYTVALGMADSMAMGPGPRAVLLTRIVAEGQRLLAALGGAPRTFAGLSGLGNLLVRTDPNSQAAGYRFGARLARSERPEPAERLPDEVKAVGAAVRWARASGQRAPILEAVARVVDGEQSAAHAADELGEQGTTEE